MSDPRTDHGQKLGNGSARARSPSPARAAALARRDNEVACPYLRALIKRQTRELPCCGVLFWPLRPYFFFFASGPRRPRASARNRSGPRRPGRQRVARRTPSTRRRACSTPHRSPTRRPRIVDELESRGRKVTHWAWWAFPTDLCGASEPPPETKVSSPAAAAELLARGPVDRWRRVLELVCDLSERRGELACARVLGSESRL